jgi:hypothetical protein
MPGGDSDHYSLSPLPQRIVAAFGSKLVLKFRHRNPFACAMDFCNGILTAGALPVEYLHTTPPVQAGFSSGTDAGLLKRPPHAAFLFVLIKRA